MIKFRIFSIKANRYLRDFNEITGEFSNSFNMWSFANMMSSALSFPTDDYIFEKFTEIHDMDGKEIYEGDILEYLCHGIKQNVHYPVYSGNALYFDLKTPDSYLRINKTRIIGHIHE